jgi:hypothetical protein
MRIHRSDNDAAIKSFEDLFAQAQRNVELVFGKNSFRRYREKDGVFGFETSVSKAVFELEMISFSYLAEDAILQNAPAIAAAFQSLSTSDQTFAESLSRATDHRKRFYQRLKLWNAELVKLGLNGALTSVIAKVQE